MQTWASVLMLIGVDAVSQPLSYKGLCKACLSVSLYVCPHTLTSLECRAPDGAAQNSCPVFCIV